jgi:hypothetical protein
VWFKPFPPLIVLGSNQHHTASDTPGKKKLQDPPSRNRHHTWLALQFSAGLPWRTSWKTLENAWCSPDWLRVLGEAWAWVSPNMTTHPPESGKQTFSCFAKEDGGWPGKCCTGPARVPRPCLSPIRWGVAWLPGRTFAWLVDCVIRMVLWWASPSPGCHCLNKKLKIT